MHLPGAHKKHRAITDFVRRKINTVLTLSLLQHKHIKEIMTMEFLHHVFSPQQITYIANIKTSRKGGLTLNRFNMTDRNILHTSGKLIPHPDLLLSLQHLCCISIRNK